jgi:phage baseplate assembly protein W
MPKKFINIKYPFQDSPQGFFLDLNATSSDAIKSDIAHLILTQKGERLYNPDFGTNLLKYVFNQNDTYSESDIKDEITQALANYLPNVKVNSITFTPSPNQGHLLTIIINYSLTDGSFDLQDILTLTI